MTVSSQGKDLSREEDFRDFEQRDVEDGWPYADDASSARVTNDAYGEAGGNFDKAGNAGFRTKTVMSDGSEPELRSPVLPETDHRENSDQIEAEITDRLDTIDGVSIDSIDVHVDGHTATLEGVVDTPTERHEIEQAVLAVPGVAQVRNMIRTAGVDTHIPDID